jgi:hypothetical protein
MPIPTGDRAEALESAEESERPWVTGPTREATALSIAAVIPTPPFSPTRSGGNAAGTYNVDQLPNSALPSTATSFSASLTALTIFVHEDVDEMTSCAEPQSVASEGARSASHSFEKGGVVIDAKLPLTQFTIAATPPIVTASDIGKGTPSLGPRRSMRIDDETVTARADGEAVSTEATSLPMRAISLIASGQSGIDG